MLFRSSRIRIALLALLVACAFLPTVVVARPHAAPTATPKPPPEDPAITAIARREFVAWQAGDVNPDHYEPNSRPNITPDKVSQTSQALGQAGSFENSIWIGPMDVDGAPAGTKGYIYKMHCEVRDVYEELFMGPSGKVIGLTFKDDLNAEPTSAPTPTPFQTP